MEIRWIRHDKVSSTNLLVSEMLKHQKPKEGLVIIADYQESGKGQGTNLWHSSEGENLLMSLLLFPAFLSASYQFHLSRVVSVAICEVLESLGADPVIKWPNDILCTRGKIAGILIEHGISGGSISHTIAGIGLNLNQSEFPEFSMPASSLFLETGKKIVPQNFAEILVERILIRYEKLKEGEEHALENEYLRRMFRLGERSLFEAGGVIFEGIIRGVSEYGELLIEKEGHIVPYGHEEIALKFKGQTE
ncbi:MAG: biotin--[acetyl-CoA-carboxylase] ligase [Bacteroidia bacterium]|nr:MAG: biotin--[acetyl-CoA-carboxylase] ligase [Bacteroidia bacterium]